MNNEHTIGGRIAGAAFVCLLGVLVGCMVAPLFGWWIKRLLYRSYYMDHDCEQKVENIMPVVWVGLWIIAFLAWAFVLAVNLC